MLSNVNTKSGGAIKGCRQNQVLFMAYGRLLEKIVHFTCQPLKLNLYFVSLVGV